jgi:hypothetical protein
MGANVGKEVSVQQALGHYRSIPGSLALSCDRQIWLLKTFRQVRVFNKIQSDALLNLGFQDKFHAIVYMLF